MHRIRRAGLFPHRRLEGHHLVPGRLDIGRQEDDQISGASTLKAGCDGASLRRDALHTLGRATRVQRAAPKKFQDLAGLAAATVRLFTEYDVIEEFGRQGPHCEDVRVAAITGDTDAADDALVFWADGFDEFAESGDSRWVMRIIDDHAETMSVVNIQTAGVVFEGRLEVRQTRRDAVDWNAQAVGDQAGGQGVRHVEPRLASHCRGHRVHGDHRHPPIPIEKDHLPPMDRRFENREEPTLSLVLLQMG